MSTENPTTPPFEIALQNLEDLVEQIESGDLALEDALAAFEKGVSLVKYCNQKLSEIEQMNPDWQDLYPTLLGGS